MGTDECHAARRSGRIAADSVHNGGSYTRCAIIQQGAMDVLAQGAIALSPVSGTAAVLHGDDATWRLATRPAARVFIYRSFIPLLLLVHASIKEG